MPDNEKVKVGLEKHGRWVRVKDWGDQHKTYLGIGEDGETSAWDALTQWEVFQVIQKLAEVSGLFLDRTGAQGLIIRRPQNPHEVERMEELAELFSGGAWGFKDLPDSTKLAISHILSCEIKEGKL